MWRAHRAHEVSRCMRVCETTTGRSATVNWLAVSGGLKTAVSRPESSGLGNPVLGLSLDHWSRSCGLGF